MTRVESEGKPVVERVFAAAPANWGQPRDCHRPAATGLDQDIGLNEMVSGYKGSPRYKV